MTNISVYRCYDCEGQCKTINEMVSIIKTFNNGKFVFDDLITELTYEYRREFKNHDEYKKYTNTIKEVISYWVNNGIIDYDTDSEEYIISKSILDLFDIDFDKFIVIHLISTIQKIGNNTIEFKYLIKELNKGYNIDESFVRKILVSWINNELAQADVLFDRYTFSSIIMTYNIYDLDNYSKFKNVLR
jgi:hypothetical protein